MWPFKPDLVKMERKRNVRGLVKLLDCDELLTREKRETRDKTCEALVRMGSSAVVHLCRALGHPNRLARQGAAQVLGRIGNPSSIASLCAALDDSDYFMRREVVEAVGRLHQKAADDRCAAALLKALGDDVGDVRREAVRALKRSGHIPSHESILALLRDSDSGKRRDAAELLMTLGVPHDTAVEIDLMLAMGRWEAVTAFGDAAVERLCAVLQDEGNERWSDVRRGAATALATMYRQGSLSPASQKMILGCADYVNHLHVDYSPPSDCHQDAPAICLAVP